MDDHFRIRLAVKMIAAFREFFPELNIVLNDPVMNDREFSVVGKMRMGVFFRRRAVRRPPGVADPHFAWHCVPVLRDLAQIRDAAADFFDSEDTVVHYSKSCRVIASVFQFFKTIQEYRRCVAQACKSNYSAHDNLSCYFPLSP